MMSITNYELLGEHDEKTTGGSEGGCDTENAHVASGDDAYRDFIAVVIAVMMMASVLTKPSIKIKADFCSFYQ